MTHGTDNISTYTGSIQKSPQYEDRLDTVLDAVRSLLLEKHNDYGSENLKRHGMFGIVVRASDKIARLENIIGKGVPSMVKDEKIDDTLLDLVGYAVQALILKDELMK